MVLRACDRTTAIGRRDYAILLLLARLGLRAGEVVSLTLDELSAYYARPVEVVSFLVSMVSLMGLVLGVVAGAVVARLGTRPVILGALALFVFVPSGVGSFIIASQYGVYESETAAAVSFTTVLSLLTVTGVLVAFG